MEVSPRDGSAYERKIAALVRKKLDPSAKRNKGSGNQWNRRGDIFCDFPIAIECKNHGRVSVHEFYQQAANAAGGHEIAMAVFPYAKQEDDDLVVLRFADLLNYLREIVDLREEVEYLRQPIRESVPMRTIPSDTIDEPAKKQAIVMESDKFKEFSLAKIDSGAKTCKNGHIVDDYGYCMQKSCQYTRGYKPKKGKK